MEAPKLTVSRLRHFIHGLATLAARPNPGRSPIEPESFAEGRSTCRAAVDTHVASTVDLQAVTDDTDDIGPQVSIALNPRLTANNVELSRHREAAADGEPEPASPTPYLESSLRYIRRLDWSRAQRTLEELTRRNPKSEVGVYLAEVRAVRRCLRQLKRRPRDPQLHLELGRLYFGLELGDEALREFRQAIQIEPGLAEGHFLMALEYLFRGDEATARQACERARACNSDLPSFEELQGRLVTAEIETAIEECG